MVSAVKQQQTEATAFVPIRRLNFYGFRVCIQGPAGLELPQLDAQFRYFDDEDSYKQDCLVTIHPQDPDYSGYPPLAPAYYTPRNICYLHEGQKIIDFHGKALVICNQQLSAIEVFCSNVELLQSIVYSLLLYLTGAHFDRVGYFRLHALGFLFRGKGVVVLLPAGGGKSTLTVELLRHPDVEILSDDAPLIQGNGSIYPNPVKVAFLPGAAPTELMPSSIQRIRYIEGNHKEFVDIRSFGSKFATHPARIDMVFLGNRHLGDHFRIEPTSYAAAWNQFFKVCVVGLGLYQGLEYAINANIAELFGKCGLAVRRAAAVSGFLRHSRNYRLQLGGDSGKNAERLVEFLSANISRSPSHETNSSR